MAAIREESLNSYLALLLDDYQQISAVAELRSGAQAIDLTVTHVGFTASLRIFIEAKIGTTSHKRRAAASQARSRLSGTPDALAFALCYPSHLKVASLSAKEREQALRDSKIWFAPVQRFGGNPTWREGSIDDLADTLRNADLSRQRIADSIEHTVREVAAMLLQANCALDIANALVLPKGVEDRQATTLIAALILSNAALLHHRLRLVPALDHVAPLETVLGKADDAPRVLRNEWNQIRKVDYYPVFFPGLAVLGAVSDEDLREPIRLIGENAVPVADELASLRFDRAGPLYHRLL